MPAPLISRPCSYSRRTEGPMPFGQTAITLMFAGNFSPAVSRYPSRKPCDRPSVEPGFSASKICLCSCACAASEMRRMVRSSPRMTSNMSPSVPSFSVKPAARASAIDSEPLRKPTTTLMPVPSSDSRRFCACAGPCEPQPMTPICLMPASAFGSRLNRCRPPRRKLSSTPSSSIVSTSKRRDSKWFGLRLVRVVALIRPQDSCRTA